jgi:hypothetical protein
MDNSFTPSTLNFPPVSSTRLVSLFVVTSNTVTSSFFGSFGPLTVFINPFSAGLGITNCNPETL